MLRSLLYLALTHRGEVTGARLRPDQIEDKLHVRHPLLSAPDDMQPFVSGRFRGVGKTVSSRKNTPPVSKYIVPAALDPNWATEMPSELSGAMPMPVFPDGMI
jgi:hypothetical protein